MYALFESLAATVCEVKVEARVFLAVPCSKVRCVMATRSYRAPAVGTGNGLVSETVIMR